VRGDCGAPESVEVTLPAQPSDAVTAVCLRVPECGACSDAEDPSPAGHLLLTVRPAEPDAPLTIGVERLDGAGGRAASGRAFSGTLWASAIAVAIVLGTWLITR
jgi:hypothetical protein